MPELPEVQTIVDDLNNKITGRRIRGVWFDSPAQISIVETWVGKPKMFKKPKAGEFEKQIKGAKVQRVARRGKNILIYLDGDKLLLIHQKMTGHLLYGKWQVRKVSSMKYQVSSLLKGPLQEKVNDYIHLVFYLDNGYQLALSDLRKFAKVMLGAKKEIEELPDLADLGPEAVDKNFTIDKFKSLIKTQKRKIKQVLMDQKVIAGIGNIYSDDMLWEAKINPLSPANQLRTIQLNNL